MKGSTMLEMKKNILGLVEMVAMLFALGQPAYGDMAAKNILLMISDGQGFNTVKATDYYTGNKAVYESFAVKGAMNTRSAGAFNGYVGKPYDPAKMWSDFSYRKSGATDSSSAATAMYSGVKIYDSQMNKTTTGAVSTVNFDHATPAAVVAKMINRNDYATITSQMINGKLNVIMGAGHQLYNNNGQSVAANYGIVGN